MSAEIVLHVDGFELHAADRQSEPTVSDRDLARALGFTRARKLRELAERWKNELGEFRPTVGRNPSGPRGGRPELTFWFTEEQALFLAAKSETEQGTAILKTLIKVFLAARDQLRARPVEVDLTLVQGARMGDGDESRAEVMRVVRATARAAGISTHRVHGMIRRNARVSSPYDVSPRVWPTIRSLCRDVADGLLVLPKRLPLHRRSDRQLELFGVRP